MLALFFMNTTNWIDIGDLVVIDEKYLGIVLRKECVGDYYFYHTQYFDEGMMDIRWVNDIFIEKHLPLCAG